MNTNLTEAEERLQNISFSSNKLPPQLKSKVGMEVSVVDDAIATASTNSIMTTVNWVSVESVEGVLHCSVYLSQWHRTSEFPIISLKIPSKFILNSVENLKTLS